MEKQDKELKSLREKVQAAKSEKNELMHSYDKPLMCMAFALYKTNKTAFNTLVQGPVWQQILERNVDNMPFYAEDKMTQQCLAEGESFPEPPQIVQQRWLQGCGTQPAATLLL